jgi:hypothetical protein
MQASIFRTYLNFYNSINSEFHSRHWAYIFVNCGINSALEELSETFLRIIYTSLNCKKCLVGKVYERNKIDKDKI